MTDDNEVQKKITSFWSTIASDYEAHPGNVPAVDTEEYREWVKALAGLLSPAPGDVLDVATGTGFVAMIAAGLGHRVTAIDLSEPMLEVARAEAQRRELKITFLQEDAITTPSAAWSSAMVRISRSTLVRWRMTARRIWPVVLTSAQRGLARSGS